MLIVSIVLFVLIGLVIGSFLNVVIDRLPAGQSLAFPASHCPSCQNKLSRVDLIPVVSYLRLKGCCRACASPIPARIFWVELTTGLAFGLLYLFLGMAPELGVALFYYCLLAVLAVIDIEQGLILNRLVYPGMVVALICSVFAPQLSGVSSTVSGQGSHRGRGRFCPLSIDRLVFARRHGYRRHQDGGFYRNYAWLSLRPGGYLSGHCYRRPCRGRLVSYSA
jgi:hypothetical protein